MKTKGVCNICKSEITPDNKQFFRHIKTCVQEKYQNIDGDYTYFLITSQGKYDPQYWMNFIFYKQWSLKKLDTFLRNTWLECCGHLSEFTIKGIKYSSGYEREYDEESMNIKISKVLEVDDTFTYIYDFGSSTELDLRILAEYTLLNKISNPDIIIQNSPPQIKCSYCDNMAKFVCCECIYEEKGWLCENCAKTHECGEDMMLPVVNSPRVGVCGYCG